MRKLTNLSLAALIFAPLAYAALYQAALIVA